MIDLHTHTNASDGSLSPSALVNHARASDIEAIAITDHDTIDGLPEAIATGEKIGIEVITGLEISAEFNPGSMHILGLLFDHNDPGLNDTLKDLQRSRAERNPKIIRNLVELGVPVTMEEVEEISGGGQVGRPHMAKALLNNGHVKSTQDAFDRFLKKGAPAYVDKDRLSPKESIDIIHNAGGMVFLAHPATLFINGSKRRALFDELKDYGLDGIEVYYSSHSVEDINSLLDNAEKRNFLICGGTDFHGDVKPKIKIGTGYGNLNIPYKVLENLKQHI